MKDEQEDAVFVKLATDIHVKPSLASHETSFSRQLCIENRTDDISVHGRRPWTVPACRP